MNYSFSIKEDGVNLVSLLLRSFMALGVIAAFFFSMSGYKFLHYFSVAFLIIVTVFVDKILLLLKGKVLPLLLTFCIAVFLATGSVFFPVLFILNWLLVKFFISSPSISFDSKQVVLNGYFKKNTYSWESFSNVMIKDQLLTLDFKSNRLLQLMVEEEEKGIPETEFNLFCKSNLSGNLT